MKLDTAKVEAVLVNSGLHVKVLAWATGVDEAILTKIRNKEVNFKTLSLADTMKIQSWIDEENLDFTYDYSGLMFRLFEDLLDGRIKGDIFIVRGPYNETLSISPIINYYCSAEDIEDSVITEKVHYEDVLSEMNLYSANKGD